MQRRAPQSVATLIVGIIAVLCVLLASVLLGGVLGIVALLMGAVAYVETRKYEYIGGGFVVAGIALGLVAIALMVVGLL